MVLGKSWNNVGALPGRNMYGKGMGWGLGEGAGNGWGVGGVRVQERDGVWEEWVCRKR